MKKTLLLLLSFAFVAIANAQEPSLENYYKGGEYYQDYQLSSQQIEKIKKLKKERSQLFQEIGKSRLLTGREKGQKKREAAIKYRKEIQKLLSKDQVKYFDKKYDRKDNEDYEDAISDRIDDQIDALEERYEAEKDKIEDNPLLSKSERKNQEKALKKAYKEEKERLKKIKKQFD
ncbi:hypothetical protein [Dysgonomonas sp. Marseille-P4361]|uniref:hypothetical protein n=1 Tax=Dysgonomonas sp. Marseille-P4361 TaxID=2161820 RepID=UPI000D55AE3C|nr:hypothetical protein [Dysgonomonas sp. Marseille-P4361]